MSVRSAVILVAVCLIGSPVAEAQRQGQSFIWPLSRGSAASAPLTATFGPSVDPDTPDTYRFHRGIDIPAKTGTPVYAIADGVVRLAGNYDYYTTPLVQLRHYKTAARTCKNGGCFYSNYMHLSKVTVREGKFVRQGQLIGYTGASPNGADQLHFEVRNAGVYQENCAHPLTILPYPNRLAPSVQIDSLVTDANQNGSLTLTAQTARGEYDLKCVTVSVLHGGRRILSRTYDMVAVNLQHSPQEDPNRQIHQQDLQGVIARPKPLVGGQTYSLQLVFYDLPNIVAGDAYQVRVKASDARGKSADVSRRLRAGSSKKQVAANALAVQS